MNILPRISDTLYHGTIDFFSSVDVTKGKSNKDFGKGFYMALEKSQAIGMMNKKFGEAVRRTRSKDPNQFSKHLYEIKLNREVIPNLKIKYFIDADMEWLDFVLKCVLNIIKMEFMAKLVRMRPRNCFSKILKSKILEFNITLENKRLQIN